MKHNTSPYFPLRTWSDCQSFPQNLPHLLLVLSQTYDVTSATSRILTHSTFQKVLYKNTIEAFIRFSPPLFLTETSDPNTNQFLSKLIPRKQSRMPCQVVLFTLLTCLSTNLLIPGLLKSLARQKWEAKPKEEKRTGCHVQSTSNTTLCQGQHWSLSSSTWCFKTHRAAFSKLENSKSLPQRIWLIASPSLLPSIEEGTELLTGKNYSKQLLLEFLFLCLYLAILEPSPAS